MKKKSSVHPNKPQEKLERWFQDAFRFHEQGDFDKAEALYLRILEKRPRYPQILYLLGTLYTQRGDHSTARNYLIQALQYNPNWPEALNNLGLTYLNLDELSEAETQLRRALELRPDYPDALNNLAGVLEKQGQLEDAMALYRRTLQLIPNNANLHYNLGLLLKRLSRLEEAALAFEQAVVFNPQHYEACNTLATIFKTLGRLTDAENWLRRTLTIYPNFHDAHNNLAAVFQAQDRLEEAMLEYDKALALRNDPLVQWNRASILLALGNLRDGWIAYEWRRPVFNWQPLPFSEWDGGSLAEKTLLVFAEQGIGDELLFASCFPDLIERARHCIFECDVRLATLYRRSFPQATIIGVKRTDRAWIKKLPQIDLQIPAGSIARYLRPSVEHFPSRPSYLVADAEKTLQWQERLHGPELKVGITWRSGLTHEGRHRNYSRINDWGVVFAVPGVKFVNLQYDDCSAELELAQRLFGVTIEHFPEVDLFNDIDGAAALTAALDLVIAAGNAAGEIAAALGIPTFRVEPYGRTWTALGTNQFPWHPRTQIFRQQRLGDWEELFNRIATALQMRAGNQAFNSGHLVMAEAQYREILERNPASPEAHNNLGSLLFENGKLEQAADSYRAALQLRADFPEAHYNLANVLHQIATPQEALTEYYAALELRPDYAEAHANLGRTLQELGRINEAEAAIQNALNLAPNLPEVQHNLGVLRHSQDRLDEAVIAYRQALKSRPDFISALYNLANALRELGLVEEAAIYARRAHELAPDDVKALTVLADVLQDLNQFTAAQDYYQRALAIKEDIAVRRNLAICLLAAGNLTSGWVNYAARKSFLNPLPLNCPEWNGESLTDQTVLILPEQGLGDELLFAVCLTHLIDRAGHCVLVCDPRLVNLYARSFPKVTVISRPHEYPLDQINLQIRMGDLPRYFCPSITDFVPHHGYLRPDPSRSNFWREKLANLGSGIKIGITWRSGLLKMARRRYYTELAQWTPLLTIPELIFINLQYDECTAELSSVQQNYGITIHSFSDIDLKNNLDEAAALTSALDLVIGVGNAALILAAALGIPTWRLDVHGRSWTTLGTNALPWFPQMKLFVQPRWGEWAPVFNQVATHLMLSNQQTQNQTASPLELNYEKVLENIHAYLRAENWMQARDLCTTYLATHQENHTVWDLLAAAENARGAYSNARDALLQAIKIAPYNANYHGHLANIFLLLGENDAAENEYRLALECNPHWAQAHNDLGNLLRTLGRIAEAERCYLSALRYKSNLVEAHNNLGTVLELQGRIAEAEAAYRGALRLRPHFPEAWYNLANCLSDLTRWNEAEAAYREALTLRPDYPQAWLYLGTALKNQQQLSAAEDAYRQALILRPNWTDALNSLANLLMTQERWDDAEDIYRAALKLNPNSHELYSNLGNCLLFAGKHADAEIACREAIKLAPDFAAAWNNLGNTLRALGRAPEGQKAFREALDRNPNLAEAHSNLGNSLREDEQLTEAEIHDRRALALRPDVPGVWVNLGNTLQSIGNLAEAESCFEHAVNLGLDSAILNLGKIRYELGRPEDAEKCMAEGVRANPNDPEMHWNLSLPMLAQGRLITGWENYEFGRHLLSTTTRRQGFHHFPEWDGGSLTGRTILVYAEQGVGDEILFASCLPDVIAQAEQCIVECDRRLVNLYMRSFPTAAIVGAKRNEQEWVKEFSVDVEIPVGSLPRFFRKTIEDFPQRDAYLIPDAQQIAYFAQKLAGPELKIGITWRSSMMKQMRRRHYSNLMDWKAIFTIPGIKFVNLQYDDCAEELAEVHKQFGIEIITFPELDLMNDLDGAAALSASLDLVIAAGNAAGEIAAAIGIPVWRLEAFGRHWTSLGTEQFPWHPRVRIFRQSHCGEWNTVLEQIANNLRTRIQEQNNIYPEWGVINYSSDIPHEENKLQGLAKYQIGLELQEEDKLDAAIYCYYEALRFDPNRADAYNNLGNIYLKRNNLSDAENCYRQALRILPNYAEAWSNLGVLLEKRNYKNDALLCFETALDLNGNLFETRYNFANLLQESGDPILAEEHFRIALRQGIDTALLWNGLALAIRDQGKFAEALDCFAKAQQRDPNEARVHWNIGLTHLIMGDLPKGWAGYEWGYNVMRGTVRGFEFPEWDGKYVPEATILIYAEQGIGDEILFISCLSDLLPWVGRCVLECEPRLAPLVKRSFPEIEVYGVMRDDQEWLNRVGTIDYQCPIGSLAYYLRRNLASFPRLPGYLLIDQEKRTFWRKRLAELDSSGINLKVGISWRSRLVGGGRARYYSRLNQWGEIFSVSRVKFINLQYDDCTAELAEVEEKFGIKIIQFSDLDRLNDFDNIAALTSALDLVIAPPNSVAEIGAATGAEVWRLDAKLPSWPRLGTDYMPWHPTMRLFQQEQLGDWENVLRKVAQELAKRVTHTTLNHWTQSATLFTNSVSQENGMASNLLLAQLVKPGAVVVQIGAGQIEIIRSLAKSVGENGRLIIFEERPGIFRRVQADLFREGLNCVQCWPDCISDKIEELPAWRVYPWDLTRSANLDADLQRANSLVACRTIDSLDLPACDLLIVDCEGREQKVLSGAANTLAKYRPLLSLGRYRYEPSESLIKFLENHRYQALIQEITIDTILLLAYPIV